MDEILLDVRGLQPPEPLERVLEALDGVTPGKLLRMLVDREPLPLYRILDRNGYRYRGHPQTDGSFVVEITTAN